MASHTCRTQRWSDLRVTNRRIYVSTSNPGRQLRLQPHRQSAVITRVYRGYNESMSRRTREYLHDGDEPIGDYLYDGDEGEEGEDEDALLDSKLRITAALSKKITISALQRAYTSSYLPPKYIGSVKLVATKSKGWSVGTTDNCREEELLMSLPPTLDLSSSFPAAAQPSISDVIRQLRQQQLPPDVSAVLQQMYFKPRSAEDKPPELEKMQQLAAEAAAADAELAAAAAAGQQQQKQQKQQEEVAASGKTSRTKRKPLIPVVKPKSKSPPAADTASSTSKAATTTSSTSSSSSSSPPARALPLSSQHLRSLVEQNLLTLAQDAAISRCRAAGVPNPTPADTPSDTSTPFTTTIIDDHTEVIDYTSSRHQPHTSTHTPDTPSSSSSSSSSRLIGFWPEHSFLNHSCLPSAVTLAVGDRLLVRALRDMGPGEEVSVCYLQPRQQLAGLEQRQQLLQERYGFTCRCPRCRFESEHQDSLGMSIAVIQQQVAELRQELQQPLAQEDTAALLAADSQLQAIIAGLHQELQQLGIESISAEVCKAPALELYLLAAKVKAALDAGTYRALRALADCVQVVSHAAPGTEVHTQMAAEFAYKVERRYGLQSARSQEARSLCFAAHRLRYGPLDMGSMKLMVKASAQCAAESAWW